MYDLLWFLKLSQCLDTSHETVRSRLSQYRQTSRERRDPGR